VIARPHGAPGGVVRSGVRRLKGAALAVLWVLAVAAAIALPLVVLQVLAGGILVGVDALFH
jgi:hypothetical protein